MVAGVPGVLICSQPRADKRLENWPVFWQNLAAFTQFMIQGLANHVIVKPEYRLVPATVIFMPAGGRG
ncbi:MAG: hypothetical protein SAqTSB_38580 [Shewanella algae]